MKDIYSTLGLEEVSVRIKKIGYRKHKQGWNA